MFDSIVIGAGAAGCVIGRELAERMNKKVLIIDQRPNIAGNCYDAHDEHNVLVQVYGPHIFHTTKKRVYDYLSRFTKWHEYQHEVAANVWGKLIPVPFNINSLELTYGKEEGKKLADKLIAAYGEGAKVSILELKKNEDPQIREVSDYVYKNVFLTYTMKQWGQTPDQIDPSVTARVPVFLSRDDRYFQDPYQGMPLDGFTKMFENMINHPNITVRLNTRAHDVMKFVDGKVEFEGKPFTGEVIYTGPLDELFDYCYGKLPYRSLKFVFEYHTEDQFQPKGVVNYTVNEDFTRITEFKNMTGQKCAGTTIMKEYSCEYTGEEGQVPCYSIINPENKALYAKYKDKLDTFNKVFALGRLAEYQYYNIDAMVEKALLLADELEKSK